MIGVAELDGIQIQRLSRGYSLEARLWLPRPPEAIFAFFADAGNLERLTPDWLRFVLLTPAPVDMRVGTLLDYRIRLRGVPLRWRSEITAWEPPRRFVDEARRSPYRYWRHEHLFEVEGDGSIVADRVEYDVPGGRWVHDLLVGPDLRRIFEYRRQVLRALFLANPDA